MAYFDKYGVEFSDDRKTLVKCPEDFQGEYVIPNSVVIIGDDAFCGGSCLTSVTIPNSVTNIGHSVFDGCSNLTSVTIPNSVTNIGHSVFDGCSSLTSINVAKDNPNYSSQEGVLFDKQQTTLFQFPEGKNGKYHMPNNVTIIKSSAFHGCKKIISPIYNEHIFAYLPTFYFGEYEIPYGIKHIAGCAFQGCHSLSSIKIPNSVTMIGENAFFGCIGLTSVTIGNGVTCIGHNAFTACSHLAAITIPDSVRNIGIWAFKSCRNLREIRVPKGQKARFEKMAGLKDFKDKIVEASLEDQKLRTWEEVNSEYRAYFERRQKENPNIQNKNGGTPLEFPPFGIELSFQEYSQFKNEGRTIYSWMFWCKSGNEIHELARLYGPIGGIGLSTPRHGYYKVVEIEGEGNDTMLVCYYNLFAPDEFIEEEDEKVRIKQKPLFNKRSSCAGPIDIGDIIHVKSTELVEDIYNGRTYQAYKIIWEFV